MSPPTAAEVRRLRAELFDRFGARFAEDVLVRLVPFDGQGLSPTARQLLNRVNGVAQTELLDLTVGIPVFNEAEAITRAVASVVNQSKLGTYEILVIDDGSTDETAAVVENLAETIPQIRLVRHARNLGRPVTRTALAREARGKYFAMLDADDEWFPDKLERQFESLQRLEALGVDTHTVMVCGNILHVDHEAKTERVKNFAEGYGKQGYGLERVLKGDNTPISQLALMRTDFLREIGEFDPALRRAQDWDFLIRFFERGGRMEFVPGTPLAQFNFRRANRDADVIERSMHQVIEKHGHLYQRYGIDPAAVKASISSYVNSFRGSVHAAEGQRQ